MIKPMAQIKSLFTVSFALLLVISLTIPAYAEVNSLKTDKTLYVKNKDTTMTFTGTAGEEDINQIVTIVIYDPGGNFVKPAHSGYVGIGKTFEVEVSEKDFSKVTSQGTYNATAFVKQRTSGVSITFDYSVDGNPIHPGTQTTSTSQPTQTTSTPSSSSSSSTTPRSQDSSDGKSIQDKIQERIEAAKKQGSQTTSTSDSEKSIEDKIKERIEAAKKSQTNTTTTGEKPTDTTTKPVTKPTEKPEETKKPDTSANNQSWLDSNVLYIAIGLGAAVAIVVAIYAMKIKPKFLAREVSDNVSTQQTGPSTQEDDYALMILKNRLAKGEITVEEFNELKKALTD